MGCRIRGRCPNGRLPYRGTEQNRRIDNDMRARGLACGGTCRRSTDLDWWNACSIAKVPGRKHRLDRKSGWLVRVGSKEFRQPLLPKGEDRPEVPPEKQEVCQSSTGGCVFHKVNHGSTAILSLEPVNVAPKPIGTDNLVVHKPNRRPPVADPAAPTQRQPAQSQPVVDLRAGSHLDRGRSQDSKLQPGRGEFFQVESVREIGEHIPGRLGQPLA